jgi:hypothetical membrane protein
MAYRVPWWAVVSSAMAPVFLIGGWTVAASRQPSGFSSVRDTISALAGLGAADRWLMTLGLLGLGLSHLATAAGLQPAASMGRMTLAGGGLAACAVAAFPLPVVGSSTGHLVAATVSFVALAVWPALAWRRGSGVPWTLRPIVSVGAAAVLLALVVWFGVQPSGGDMVGLVERVAAGAESMWPLVVVVGAIGHNRQSLMD